MFLAPRCLLLATLTLAHFGWITGYTSKARAERTQLPESVGSFIESLIPMPPRGASRTTVHEAEGAEHAEHVAVVVCHGGVIEAFFEYVFEKGPWSVVAVDTNNAAMTHLEFLPLPNRPDWHLHYHNRIAHLDPAIVT